MSSPKYEGSYSEQQKKCMLRRSAGRKRLNGTPTEDAKNGTLEMLSRVWRALPTYGFFSSFVINDKSKSVGQAEYPLICLCHSNFYHLVNLFIIHCRANLRLVSLHRSRTDYIFNTRSFVLNSRFENLSTDIHTYVWLAENRIVTSNVVLKSNEL